MELRYLATATGLALLLAACSPGGGDGLIPLPQPDGFVQVDNGADVSGDALEDATSGETVVDDTVADTAADLKPELGPEVGPPDAGPELPPQPAGILDPNCVDGQYAETLPPGTTVDIAGFINGYDGTSYRQLIDAVLEARYPIGAALVKGGVENSTFGDCIDFFISNTGSASAVIGQLSTVVHECGHFYDIALGGFGSSTYVVTESLTLECQGASYQGSGATFERALIRDDQFSVAHPPCSAGQFSGCDSYADVYLDGDGDHTTGEFDGGDQGFNSVLEETTQYVNSLATGYAFNDQYTSTVSERDGLLTFLWYLTRYLNYGRTKDVTSYEVLASSSCWRNAILTIWGRAWLYLSATESMPQLGIDDDKLYGLVTDPVLLNELELLRERHGCQ